LRDPNRIYKFCGRLAKAWSMLPDWRFGQLMMNALGEMAHEGRDPFFPEEEEMIEFIEKFCACSPYRMRRDEDKEEKKNE